MSGHEISLGSKVRDTISGFKGIVVAKTEWLNGCVRITIAPQALHDGKLIDSATFDSEQVEVLQSAKPKQVMPIGGPPISPTRNPDPR